MVPQLLEWARTEMSWPLAVVLVVLGLVVFIFGLSLASDVREIKTTAKFYKLELSGAIVFPFLGLIMIIYPFWDPPGYVPDCTQTGSCIGPTDGPTDGPTGEPTPTLPQNWFRTPSGLQCSTFTDRVGVGCVMYVKDNAGNKRQWKDDKNQDCTVLYTLGVENEPTVEPCPKDADLSKLTRYPVLASDANAMKDYAHQTTFKMGTVTCKVVRRTGGDLLVGTTCTNPAGHKFRVARREHEES